MCTGCMRLFPVNERPDGAPQQELRGIGLGGFEVPEWKTKALGKAPTFGFSDVRPIKEQRESLPIFKLRDQLIEAVNTHQVGAACTFRV